MSLTRLEAPPLRPMTLAEVKARIKVEHDEDDDLILAYLDAATGSIDGARGWLGRALVAQQWSLTLEAFPGSSGRIAMPLPPLISVDGVTYVDAADGVQTLTEGTDFDVLRSSSGVSYLAPSRNKAWPVAQRGPEAVSITFTAGYVSLVTDGSPQVLAEPTDPAWFTILAALGLMVGDLYANRETVGGGLSKIDMSTTIAALLEPIRIGGVG